MAQRSRQESGAGMSNTPKRKKISIGVEDFKEIIQKNGYFVDKSLMIKKAGCTDCGDCFGFTETEVGEMLACYDLQSEMPEVKACYDGYSFAGIEIYNPWSILNYVYDHDAGITELALPYWSNTSSNSIVREMIGEADSETRSELEVLMDGGMIRKRVHEDISYGDIHQTQGNLWNFLFFTGYLKKISKEQNTEDYYHGFMAGLLTNAGEYRVLSNRESRNGRPDITGALPRTRKIAIMSLYSKLQP